MRPISRLSTRGLDSLNFFLADARAGIAPYLGIYLLADRHWNLRDIGVITSITSFAGVLVQPPAGAWVDRARDKHLLVSLACLASGTGTLIPVLAAGFGWVALSQVLVGMAAALVGPCVTALTLGLVGYRALERRTGRNEVFNHAGNVFAAVSSGCIGYLLGLQAIFVFVFGLSAAAVASVYLIRKPEVDHALARGARTGTSLRVSMDKKGLLRNPAMRLFLVCCLLFHLGNAAMLPLAGQYLVVKSKVDGAIYMSACILIAQAVMVPVAAWAGQKALGGRKRLMLLCFVLLPVRGILYTLGSDPYYITAIQALDGAAAAIFGVASVLIVADLSRETGHFNFAAGLMLTAVGVGASFSDLLAGWLAAAFSFRVAFLFLSAVAALAALLYAVGMRETYRPPQLAPA